MLRLRYPLIAQFINALLGPSSTVMYACIHRLKKCLSLNTVHGLGQDPIDLLTYILVGFVSIEEKRM